MPSVCRTELAWPSLLLALWSLFFPLAGRDRQVPTLWLTNMCLLLLQGTE